MKYLLLTLASIYLSINCYCKDLTKNQRIIHDIDSIRTQFHIPAVSFGVANCDSILLLGTVGVREINTLDSVTINDKFHIASLGKGLTSFIAGKLVDEGKISWNTRFFDLFPEMKETSRQEYHNIELKDLLSHRALLQPLNSWDAQKIIDRYNELNRNSRFCVYNFSKFVLTLEPVKYDSGQFYKYSSLGYLLASLMLEKVSGSTYAQLLAKTNKDIGLDFQIGWPKDSNKYQPSGHLIPAESGWGQSTVLEVLNGDKFTDWGQDFLYYNIPSGHHSVSAGDFLKYLQLNLNGINGQDNYIKSSTYDFIFNGAKEYSMGWGNDIVNGNHYYSHSGSAGNFNARAIIIKEPKIAIIIMANAGNNETIGGLLQIIKLLEDKFAHITVN